MKKIYLSLLTLMIALTVQAQTTGQIMDFSLEFIGFNEDSQAEIALIATPDFTQANGNSSDMGIVVSLSGGAAIVTGNSAFVNDGVGFPPVNEYAIPKSEWDITFLEVESAATGNNVYQILRNFSTINTFFDAVAGEPIIMAVFKVFNGTALAPPTSGSIVAIKNSDPLLVANTQGNSNFLNINFPGLPSGTIDLYPGDPNPGDDGFTPAFSVINFATLSVPNQELVGVSVYPNPTKDVVTIRGVQDLKSVAVYNITGQRVLNNTQNLQTIDLSTLKSGIYFAKVQAKTGTTTLKIIKE